MTVGVIFISLKNKKLAKENRDLKEQIKKLSDKN